MAKKKKVTKAPSEPAPDRIYTYNNGGRHQAIHQSGTMVAMASAPVPLEIPKSFITDDGVAVLAKDCDVEALLDDELADHAGLEAALHARRERQEAQRAAPPAGPTIVTGEIPTVSG